MLGLPTTGANLSPLPLALFVGNLLVDWPTVLLCYRALGCRLDSGDLSYLSQEVRRMVAEASIAFERPFLAATTIVASNDINEDSLHSLADQVRSYGVIARSLNRRHLLSNRLAIDISGVKLLCSFNRL